MHLKKIKMKNLFNILLLCITIIVFSNVETKSQCSNCVAPATQESITMQLSGTSCSFTINYCLLCSPSGNTIATLCSIVFPNPAYCYGIPLPASFFEDIRKAIAKDGALKCAIANGIPIGPCPNRSIIETYLPTCARWVFNETTNGVSMVPCLQLAAQCFQEWEICFDDPDYVITKIGQPYKESGVCEREIIILPPNQPNENDCFEICF